MTNDRFSDPPDITHREITAVVKWFNPAKGFGFVEPSDGSPDAFMPVSVVERAGLGPLPQGATLLSALCAGQQCPPVRTRPRLPSIPAAPPQPPS